MGHSVGILTGGGDAPGLNAVIRAVIKAGVGKKGWRLLGVEDSFNGLMKRPMVVRELSPIHCKGLLPRGGTILGTTNRGDPFHWGKGEDHSDWIVEAMGSLGLEGLIVLGGDGTQAIALKLQQKHGIKVVGVPKTIDNDLGATELCFGFQSAVDCVTDALDRLHSTAESHDRVLLLEVMGRDAGWIALHGGIAGGADIIVIPEIPWTQRGIALKIEERRAIGRNFSLVVVAEGARPEGQSIMPGKAAEAVAAAIKKQLPDTDLRTMVLGHLQRGGSPVAFDRVLATRLGVGAVDAVERGDWGKLICLQGGKIVPVALEDAVAQYRTVDPEGELVRTARAVGISFGDF
jgi:6-phosphofructokinase 1